MIDDLGADMNATRPRPRPRPRLFRLFIINNFVFPNVGIYSQPWGKFGTRPHHYRYLIGVPGYRLDFFGIGDRTRFREDGHPRRLAVQCCVSRNKKWDLGTLPHWHNHTIGYIWCYGLKQRSSNEMPVIAPLWTRAPIKNNISRQSINWSKNFGDVCHMRSNG